MHETVDGETIVIDLETGTYYTLRGSAPAIWSALVAGASPDAIVQSLEHAYEAPPEQIAGAVRRFLDELERERLIAPTDEAGWMPPEPQSAVPVAFPPPHVEKYEDLQDIILLDPVHMVDDRGWPHPAATDGSGA